VNSQLQAIVAALEGAGQRVQSLLVDVPAAQWTRRPEPGRWSAAECVAHLNLSSEAILPLLRSAVHETASAPAPVRYRRDPLGWVVWRAMAPSGGLKTRTAPTFEPRVVDTPEDLVADFIRLQAGLTACVADAEGRQLDRVTLRSPFDARIRYNLYSALTLVPRHQHRHLLQAEQAALAAEAVVSPATARGGSVWSRA